MLDVLMNCALDTVRTDSAERDRQHAAKLQRGAMSADDPLTNTEVPRKIMVRPGWVMHQCADYVRGKPDVKIRFHELDSKERNYLLQGRTSGCDYRPH
jgi:hypothetical protein